LGVPQRVSQFGAQGGGVHRAQETAIDGGGIHGLFPRKHGEIRAAGELREDLLGIDGGVHDNQAEWNGGWGCVLSGGSVQEKEGRCKNREHRGPQQPDETRGKHRAPKQFPSALVQIGMGSRGVKASARGKPSGLPFHAHFVNVAQKAGLRAPVIYGDAGFNDYILDSMGCGVAFLDYDNDGWQDIVVLTGRRWQATPEEAFIQLYRNNRDGTFTTVLGPEHSLSQ
jgi:hypothetical protein